MADTVVLRVGNRDYAGWESMKLTRSIEALAGSFSLTVVDRWAGQRKPWPIREGDECSVIVNDVPVLTGFVDARASTLGPDEKSITLEGRDRTCDLVDSSAQLGTWSFTNVSILALAQKICDPYGIKVSLQPGLNVALLTIPKKYSIDPGDTAARALLNACKVAGVLAVSDGLGNIVLTRSGTEVLGTSIVEGVNLKGGTSRFDHIGRFHKYEVMGSHKGRDDLSGEDAAGVRGIATDQNIRASRVLIVRPDGNLTPSLAKQRAEWEAQQRAAHADTARVVVAGWQESAFEPVWPLNKRVRVKSPSLSLNGTMLVAGVTLTRDIGSGTTAALDLRDPNVFVPDPTIVKSAGGNNYWKEIERGVTP